MIYDMSLNILPAAKATVLPVGLAVYLAVVHGQVAARYRYSKGKQHFTGFDLTVMNV
jgi:hypothetical protein